MEISRKTFGEEPKVKNRSSLRLYSDRYEHIAYPQGAKIPEFVKFSGDDSRSTLEHIGQFIVQYRGEVSSSDINKLRLFPLSLLSAALT